MGSCALKLPSLSVPPSHSVLLSHGNSASVSFTIPDAAALLAGLVGTPRNSKNCKAGITGTSLEIYTAKFVAQNKSVPLEVEVCSSEAVKLSRAKQTSKYTGAYGLTTTLSALMFTHLPKSWFERMKEKFGIEASKYLLADMKDAATNRMRQIVMERLADLDEVEAPGWVE